MLITQENGLSFQLFKNTYTAKIINSPNITGDINIPRSINHDEHEYIITSISKDSFKNNKAIKSIQFANDSKIQKIEKDAFFRSSIENISIPLSVNELEEGWCNQTWELTQISISKNNPNFAFLNDDNKIIIGKSDKNKEIFDVIVFACRNIRKAVIPSTIKHIASFSFSECSNLDTIEFSEDSNLLTIGKEAFARSSIKSFFIPSNVFILGDGWCSYTHFLNHVSISKGNKNFIFIDDDRKMIAGKTKQKKKSYNILLFACRNITKAVIPSTIKHIGSYAFCGCRYLENIQFYKDTKLRTIGKEAFSCSLLESISIPMRVKRICERTFYGCDNLNFIEFSENSKLHSIEKDAFSNSSIESIFIPASTEVLKDGWCSSTQKLIKISISKNNKNFKFIDKEQKIIVRKSKSTKKSFDVLVCASRDLVKAIIPSSIKYICPFAFYGCGNLESIEFSNDSKLRSIGKEAFSFSSLERISIPSKVTHIGERALSFCRNLKVIQFSEESEIKSFGKDVFYSSSIESISIPSRVEKLDDGWCCKNLQLTDISISRKNKYFSYLDKENKIIIGKSETNLDFNDVLLFACRDITHVVIPATIKHISSYSFADCSKLEAIEFSSDSNLQTIGENAFSFSSIDHISIPKSVNKIGKSAFSYCQNLKTIQIPDDSNLSTFEKDLFYHSVIENISIPSNLIELKEGWCRCTQYLNNVSISPNNKHFVLLNKNIILRKSALKNEFYDVLEFAFRNISHVQIPSTIKRINSFAFSECSYLKTIEFTDDSQLEIIGDDAFSFTQINGIFIPKNTKKIGVKAFQGCQKLKSVEFLCDNLVINYLCFSKCSCLFLASFPNAHNVFINRDVFLFISKEFTLFICCGGKII